MPEIIKDGVNGFVIEPREHEKLSSRIIELLTDSELGKRLGETGYSMVQEKYTEDHVTDATLSLYDKLL
jgi:glycosyltransferase involved in cell wall biosynthesis